MAEPTLPPAKPENPAEQMPPPGGSCLARLGARYGPACQGGWNFLTGGNLRPPSLALEAGGGRQSYCEG
jgi:hypothetical protein